MQVDEARRVLGFGGQDALDLAVLRTTYRRLVRSTHPDVNDRPDASDRTARITLAYRVLTTAIEQGRASNAPASTGPVTPGRPAASTRPATATAPRQPSPPAQPRIGVRLLDDDSISVAAPAEETLMLLLDTAHSLGEIGYLDRTAGLVEVIVEFVEAPTSSVLFSLQGRGDGTTEVFCTVEPLSGGEAPPAAAVTRLVLATLRDGQLSDPPS